MPTPVFETLLATPEVIAVFGETAVVQAMFDFESARARALAAEGVIPVAAAQAIAGVCKAELFDVRALVAAGRRAGDLAAPVIGKLTEAVALFDAEAASYVHWGSTSQDTIDTAMVLVTRRALALIDRDLTKLIEAGLSLAHKHGAAPMLARSLMQPTQVISLGLKLVSWIAPLLRSQRRLRAAAQAALQLQWGGDVSALALLGERGVPVARRMAETLQLVHPPGAWHTQRDEMVALACEMGVLAGNLGKIAKDISLLARDEIGEVSEPPSALHSNARAMPFEHDSTAAMVALSAVLRVPHRVSALLAAMVQGHAAGLGNWQAELAESSGLYIAAHGTLKTLAEAVAGLVVDEPRMLRNIEAQHGLVFAQAVAKLFARHMGRARAHQWVGRLSQEVMTHGTHLRDVTLHALAHDDTLRERVDAAEVAALFDPVTAAQRAGQVAQPQLDVLRKRAAAMAAQAPWVAWL